MKQELDGLLQRYLDSEAPTERRDLVITLISKLSALHERTEVMMDVVRMKGVTEPLAKTEAIRALMRIRELVSQLEILLRLRQSKDLGCDREDP